MSEKIGKYAFAVEPFSEDFSGRLSWKFLGNHLLRCASLHAHEHGFGYEAMMQSRHVWVLSRLVVDLEDMPRTGDAYVIDTWVAKIYRQFTDRLYRISGDGGRTFGYAISTWALIDIDNRQAADFSSLPCGDFSQMMTETGVPVKGAGRVRVKSTEAVGRVTASYSDLDINGHVNSIRYIEMILDLFSRELCENRLTVKRIEMAYCSESYCGETLEFYHDAGADGVHYVEVRKANGEVVVKAAVVLK